MKKFLLILVTVANCTGLLAPSGINALCIIEPEVLNPYLPVWTGVKYVEIGNLPDSTINYDEDAYGPGQIRQAKLEDFNLATGKSYTLKDCLKEHVAREIFMWHCMQHIDIDLAIRCWNGSGPATYEYLKKVRRQYDRLQAFI
jgi:hypothetical protein